MHNHSFKNEHGRFPVTTDVLQNIQHDIQMLSKAIAGMGGDAAIFTKGGDVAAVDGEVVESHGRGKCIKKLMDSKNFAVQGEIYDVLETTGYLNDNYGRTHSDMFDLPSKFASLEAYDRQLRDTIELRSNDLNTAMATRFADYAAQLAELRNQLAQAVNELRGLITQTSADINTQIANINKQIPPKGTIATCVWVEAAIKLGWVPCMTNLGYWKDKLADYWGSNITFELTGTRNTYAVATCNGLDLRALRGQEINGRTVFVKCI